MNRDLTLAILAMDSYYRSYGKGIKLDRADTPTTAEIGRTLGNVSIIAHSNSELNSDEVAAGFYAIAYRWNGETIISYRGTDNQFANNNIGGDVPNGWLMGVGMAATPQAKMAVDFYNSVVTILGGGDPRLAPITTTGHSLGGGLAGFVSGLHNRSGVLFDNMAFELAVNEAYKSANGSNQPLLWPDIKESIYGSGPTWTPSIAALKTIYTKGEILEADRLLQTTGQTALDPHVTGLSPFTEYHSMALLVALEWAKTENKVEWFSAGDALWHAFFNPEIGSQINEAQLRTDNQFGNAASTVRAAIAYSALSEGARPFGDTGIIAMFDDATDLGKAPRTQSPKASFNLLASWRLVTLRVAQGQVSPKASLRWRRTGRRWRSTLPLDCGATVRRITRSSDVRRCSPRRSPH